MEIKNQKKAYIYGLSAVLIWSTVASAFKLGLSVLEPSQLLFFAALFSVFILLLIIIKQKKLCILRQMKGSEILKNSLLGIINPFLYYLILFKAYSLLPAQEAQPLNYTWAVTLSLLAIPILKQKMTAKEFLAIIISYLGVVVISTHGNILNFHFSNPYGVFLALFSTILWSFYWIFNTKSKTDPLISLFLHFCLGLPCIFIYMIYTTGLPNFNLQALLATAYIGCFEMGITFTLWLTALKLSTKASKISNLIFISPFLSLILIHFIVGEEILSSTFAGLVLIVAGNIIQQIKFKKRS